MTAPRHGHLAALRLSGGIDYGRGDAAVARRLNTDVAEPDAVVVKMLKVGTGTSRRGGVTRAAAGRSRSRRL